MAFTGDSNPTRHEAEQSKGVDVFIHELFIDAPTLAERNNMPLKIAENVVDEHTPADKLGHVFSIAKPKLGVGTLHYFGRLFLGFRRACRLRGRESGPVVLEAVRTDEGMM